MKQHITTKQLNELSEKGKERLLDYWLKHHNGVGHLVKDAPEEYCDFLSIGQMIEFLIDKNQRGNYDDFNLSISGVFCPGMDQGWQVNTLDIERYYGDVLVDCLWEAVKEVLEE